MADKQRFGQMSFHGGQQVFGDHNEVRQENTYHYGDRRDEIVSLLAQVRRVAPDPELVEPQIVIIERALEQRAVEPDDRGEARGRVEQALADLARNVGNVRTAAEALTAIGAIVATHWPF